MLADPVILFRPMIRESDKIWDGRKMLPASIIFSHLQRSQIEVLSSCCWVWERLVYMIGWHLKDEDLLVIVSSDSIKTIISDSANDGKLKPCSVDSRQENFGLN